MGTSEPDTLEHASAGHALAGNGVLAELGQHFKVAALKRPVADPVFLPAGVDRCDCRVNLCYG
jgi:hypothetical protein